MRLRRTTSISHQVATSTRARRTSTDRLRRSWRSWRRWIKKPQKRASASRKYFKCTYNVGHGFKQFSNRQELIQTTGLGLIYDHFATLQRGKDLTRDHFRTGNVPVAGSNGIIGYHDTANVRAPGHHRWTKWVCWQGYFLSVGFLGAQHCLVRKGFHGNVPAFIAFFLDFLRLGRFGSGASVPTLDRNVFRTLPIVIPPPCEQRKIAAVLGLVQRAIEQQERLIALTTELKKALLHKLFTEGLRGESQKQTEIGPVPESWEVLQLGACCDV